MKSNRVIILIVVDITLFSFLLNSINFYYYSNRKELFNTPINQLEKKTHSSNYWNLTGSPILIDGNDVGIGAHNWTWFENQAWYGGGNGTSENPYIIENITIDGQGIGSCIYIRDSSKYFIIRNCTLYNSGSNLDDHGGIRLESANNGKIINNNCSNNNANGIIINWSNNNSVTGNVLNNNDHCGLRTYYSNRNLILLNNISHNNNGIYLDVLWIDSRILYNTINNNSYNGIRIDKSQFTNISNNKIYANKNSGVFISEGRNNIINNNDIYNNDYSGIETDNTQLITISRNDVTSNDNGIYLEGGAGGNNIFRNNVSSNKYNGILLMNSERIDIINNNVIINEIGINLQNINNTNIMENNIINNTFIGLNLFRSNYNIIIRNRFDGTQIPFQQDDESQDNHLESNIGLSFSNNRFPLELVILILISIITLSSVVVTITIGRRIFKIRSSQKELDSKKKLSSRDLKELRKTEAELSIEKESHVCIVHRGKIVGTVYICPSCETYYCMKCAITLKEKNENCWVCNNKIDI